MEKRPIYLGSFEEVVLLAIFRLGESACGASVHQALRPNAATRIDNAHTYNAPNPELET